MSNILDKKMNTFGSLAAVKTVTNAYPVLNRLSVYGTNDGLNVSIDYLLNLLNLVGVTKTDIIDFICKLLCGEKFYSGPDNKFKKVGDGMLDVIEETVKALLLTNCKNMFSGCQVDPFIPDYLLSYVNPSQSPSIYGGKGIDFNINHLDTFGVLTNCPVDDNGSIFYFDCKPTIYKDNSGNTSSYNVSEVWKSMDFNAFLWYVINKGNNSVGEHYKCTWDNRCKNKEKFKSDHDFRDRFYQTDYPGGAIGNLPIITSSDGTIEIEKTPYLICDYHEFAGNNESNVLRVWLPADRYYRTGMKWVGNSRMNKTIFEFNYDYIFSLKLFDSKTLVANVINSLVNLGGTANINVSMSFEQEMIREKISRMVDEVMMSEADDDETEKGCTQNFSNQSYDLLLKDADRKHAGEIYKTGDVHFEWDKVKDKIRNIDYAENQSEAISNVLNELVDTLIVPSFDAHLNVSMQYDVISNFLKQTVTEIVMQLLSPKIMLLFAINQAVMGDVINDIKDLENGKYVFSPEEIINGMLNMIYNIIKQILSMLLEQLQEFLFEKIKPLLKLFTSKLLLETVRDYKDLITQLLTACLSTDGLRFEYGALGEVSNDILKADIIPYQQAPRNNDC